MNIHVYIYELINKWGLNSYIENIVVAAIEIILITVVTFLFDFILKKIALFISWKLIKKDKFTWYTAAYNNKVINSLCHFITLATLYFVLSEFFTFKYSLISKIIDKTIYIGFVYLFIQLFSRVTDMIIDISTHKNDHRMIAIRSIAQFTRIMFIILGVIFIISILVKEDFKVVFGSLSALTAVIVLVFKDVILGAVAGVQIASTKILKVGDWIALPKEEVDGKIIEINLVSAKIRNWDKTISTIPTYDLISKPLKSYEAMKEANVRRIKRSLIFNVKSFKFLEEADIEDLEKFNILRDYLESKRVLMTIDEKTGRYRANGKRITNIGTFRKYTEFYLEKHPDISQDETIMVRQLDPTPYGMPLEVYCFTEDSDWKIFEQIQSDIFDHLLTITQDFGLEIVQVAQK